MKNGSFDLSYIKKVHFIGIGGISMSGLASILHWRGHLVTGSDIRGTHVTEKLFSSGIPVRIGHDDDNIENPDLVVFNSAIDDTNPELKKALGLNIPVVERAYLLGYIMNSFENSIAIGGTHGKTTTTAMASMILMEAMLDPTIHIGGELDYIKGSVRMGNSSYFITEACEYKDNFHRLNPKISVILNVDLDHTDYFKDINQMKQSFVHFANGTRQGGLSIICADDENILSMKKDIEAPVMTFGIDGKDIDYRGVNLAYNSNGSSSYTLMLRDKKIIDIKLNSPGKHNIYNSLAAAAAAMESGCSPIAVKNGLEKFHSTHRRFEYKGLFKGTKVIDDYAHHPSEIKATLSAADSMDYDRIWCIFQPHTYTRTKSFLDDFAKALVPAHQVILTDIYGARETNTSNISSWDLVDKINGLGGDALFLKDFCEIRKHLDKHVQENDLILTLGAGDIYEIADRLILP